MIDEESRIAGEITAYCQDAITLEKCVNWAELEVWLVEAKTEPWHEYENMLALKTEYGDDFEAVKSRLLVDYIGKKITRPYIAFRNSLEYEKLENDKKTGAIDQQQFDRESLEMSRMHARLYERLDL